MVAQRDPREDGRQAFRFEHGSFADVVLGVVLGIAISDVEIAWEPRLWVYALMYALTIYYTMAIWWVSRATLARPGWGKITGPMSVGFYAVIILAAISLAQAFRAAQTNDDILFLWSFGFVWIGASVVGSGYGMVRTRKNRRKVHDPEQAHDEVLYGWFASLHDGLKFVGWGLAHYYYRHSAPTAWWLLILLAFALLSEAFYTGVVRPRAAHARNAAAQTLPIAATGR